MEKEIEKRNAHCNQQRENAEKRWNKKNDAVGIPFGNAMALPLGNGNGNGNGNKYISSLEAESYSAREGFSGVLSAYANRINPTPSEICLAELERFCHEMGAECCMRAIQIAQDNRVTNWGYVKKILRNKLNQGVRCLADWDALEAKREGDSQSDYWTK